MINGRSLHGSQIGAHPLRHLRVAQGVDEATREAKRVFPFKEGEEVIVFCLFVQRFNIVFARTTI